MTNRKSTSSLFLIVFVLLVINFTTSSYRTFVREPVTGWTVPGTPPHITPTNVLFKPHEKGLIVIDPGHGGKDFGTYSRKTPRYQEKHLNLSTAFMLRNFLNQLGYDVVLTRESDHFVALDKRAEFANEQNPRLFISLHYNSAPNKEAEGIEIYYYRSQSDWTRSSSSRKLAQAINKGIIKNAEAKSRGVKHGDLAVIRLTNMPAVLIEGGFLTNENELSKIKTASYLKKIAWGIALGINDYLIHNPNNVIAKKSEK